jgi:hypothetical protein
VTSVGGTAYTYDNNGNVTAIGSLDYTWDWRNRLASAEGSGGPQVRKAEKTYFEAAQKLATAPRRVQNANRQMKDRE